MFDVSWEECQWFLIGVLFLRMHLDSKQMDQLKSNLEKLQRESRPVLQEYYADPARSSGLKEVARLTDTT